MNSGFYLKWISILFLSSLWMRSCYGLFEDEAGIVDKHISLMGVPSHVKFIPGSVLVGSVDESVLGVLDSHTGGIRWRQKLPIRESLLDLLLNEKLVISLSTTNSSFHVRSWNALTGNLVWEYVNSVSNAITSFSLYETSGILVAATGKHVSALNATTGDVSWTITLGKEVLSTSIAGATLYLMAESGSEGIKVVAYNLESGTRDKVIGSVQNLNSQSSSLCPTNNNIYVIDSEKAVLVDVVSGKSINLCFNNSSCKAKSSLIYNGKVYAVVETVNSTPVLVSVEGDQLKTIHYFSTILTSQTAYSALDTPIGTLLTLANVESGKIYFESVQLNVEFVESTATSAPLISSDYGNVVTISCDPRYIEANRCIIVTQDGSVMGLNGRRVVWHRPEYLTQISSSVFVELPAPGFLTEDNDELHESSSETARKSILDRLSRRVAIHVSQLQEFFQQTTSRDTPSTKNETLLSDRHGFRKLIVFATRTGKMEAIDTLTGASVWSKYIPKAKNASLFLTRDSRIRLPPYITYVGHDTLETSSVGTLDGFTGESISIKGGRVNYKVDQSFALNLEDPVDRQIRLLLIGQDKHAHIYPEPASLTIELKNVLSNVTIFVPGEIGSSKLEGYTINVDDNLKLRTAWTIELPDGEKIAAIAKPTPHEPVASLGRVLGDRRVLYKYLNPSMVSFITVKEDVNRSSSFVYIIDTVSGSIYYRNVHFGAGNRASDAPSIFLLQKDHMIIYTLFHHGWEKTDKELYDSIETVVNTVPLGQKTRKQQRLQEPEKVRETIPDAKGWEVTVLEVFENEKPDVRVSDDSIQPSSSHRPFVQAKSFTFSKPVTALGSTITLAGIAQREILFGLEVGSLQGMSRKLLDVRRPTGAPSSADKEEGLVPYKPDLPFHSREVASYHLPIFGIETIQSAPTNLESTSVVVAYGTDLFLTRRTPSNAFDVLQHDFNYVALVSTMIALAVGVVAARHYAERKKFREEWL